MNTQIEQEVLDIVLGNVDKTSTPSYEALCQQTVEFFYAAFPDIHTLDSSTRHDVRRLSHFNFQLVETSSDANNFAKAVEKECRTWIQKLHPECDAAGVASFLVQHCDINLLEDCTDFLEDPDDDEEGLTGLFMALVPYAIKIVNTRQLKKPSCSVDSGESGSDSETKENETTESTEARNESLAEDSAENEEIQQSWIDTSMDRAAQQVLEANTQLEETLASYQIVVDNTAGPASKEELKVHVRWLLFAAATHFWALTNLYLL